MKSQIQKKKTKKQRMVELRFPKKPSRDMRGQIFLVTKIMGRLF